MARKADKIAPKTLFGRRIQQLLAKHNFSAYSVFEHFCGIARGSVSRYMRGMQPTPDTLKKIALKTGVTPGWLMGYDPFGEPISPCTYEYPNGSDESLPVVGSAAAGAGGNGAMEPRAMCNIYGKALVKVLGDELAPLARDGYFALIDTRRAVNDGDLVVASIQPPGGENYCILRTVHFNNGEVFLVAPATKAVRIKKKYTKLYAVCGILW